MKILLTTEFFPSGQSTHVIDLAIQLTQLGHQVVIIFAAVHTSAFKDFYGPLLTKHEILYYLTGNFKKSVQITKYFKPDIIHSHSSTLFDITRKLAKLSNVAYVVTCHGMGFAHPKYHQALAGAAQIIGIGPNSIEDIYSKYRDKLIIIPNGIDVRRFVPGKKELKLNIYYVGRIDWSKVYAIKKLALVVQKIAKLKLKIVGNWQPPIDDVDYLPWQNDLAKLLKSVNIVACCGRTAREALASGCAVLLMNTTYDGLIDARLVRKPDFDFSGNCGRYKFSRLFSDLKTLANNHRLLQTIQKFSRKYAENNLSSRDMAKKIVDLYTQALQKKPRQYKLR